jgi:hypothetical protein
LLNPVDLSTNFLLLLNFYYGGVNVPCVTSLLAICLIFVIVQHGAQLKMPRVALLLA